MGADLHVTTIWAKRDSKLFWEKGHDHIDNLKDDAAVWDDSYFDYMLRSDESVEDDAQKARVMAHKDLDHIKGLWAGDTYSRECAWIAIGPYEAIVTGGMTAGDPPTDLSTVFDRLISIDALYAVGFYQE